MCKKNSRSGGSRSSSHKHWKGTCENNISWVRNILLQDEKRRIFFPKIEATSCRISLDSHNTQRIEGSKQSTHEKDCLIWFQNNPHCDVIQDKWKWTCPHTCTLYIEYGSQFLLVCHFFSAHFLCSLSGLEMYYWIRSERTYHWVGIWPIIWNLWSEDFCKNLKRLYICVRQLHFPSSVNRIMIKANVVNK